MLRITVTNEQQSEELTHESGTLFLGRQPPEDGAHVVIDDKYVSRDQMQLEELSNGMVRVANRGNSPLRLDDGTELPLGEEREVELPFSVRAGQTDVEILQGDPNKSVRLVTRTLDTADFEGLQELTLANISENYPFPLAYGFRLTAAITTPAEQYKEQLRLAENVLCFVAGISLALLDDQQFATMNDKVGGSVLEYWQGGISPGDWLSLAIHATGLLSEGEMSSLARALVNLNINKDKKRIGKRAQEMVRAKNDYKHDRGPSIESEYRSAAEGMGKTLLEVYEFLSFLTHHPIRLVQDVNPRRRGGQSDVTFLRCMGDHPGFPSEQSIQSQNLRKGDLYVEASPGQLIPLHPFIRATTCPQCKAREIYFIDRLDLDRASGKHVAGLKSFDRGHTTQDPEIGDELSEIFRAR